MFPYQHLESVQEERTSKPSRPLIRFLLIALPIILPSKRFTIRERQFVGLVFYSLPSLAFWNVIQTCYKLWRQCPPSLSIVKVFSSKECSVRFGKTFV